MSCIKLHLDRRLTQFSQWRHRGARHTLKITSSHVTQLKEMSFRPQRTRFQSYFRCHQCQCLNSQTKLDQNEHFISIVNSPSLFFYFYFSIHLHFLRIPAHIPCRREYLLRRVAKKATRIRNSNSKFNMLKG